MSYFKILSRKILWKLINILLPKKYRNYYFVFDDFLSCPHLKKLTIRKALWCFFKGFNPEEYFIYDLKNNDYRKYIPSLVNCNQMRYRQSYNQLFFNKLLFEKHMQTVVSGIDNLHVISSLGYIEKGVFKSTNHELPSGNFFVLKPFLEENDLVLKPIFGAQGKDIYFLKKENEYYYLESKKLSWEELISELAKMDDYLVQERFMQKGLSNDIYSGSLNTMRICTMIDPVSGNSFIPYALHRFGSQKSGLKDNFCQGGVAAMIDKEGKLSKLISISEDGKKDFSDSHPISNKQVFNEQIENWQCLTDSIIRMSERMPYLKNVGWDFVLSDNELYILEGNMPQISLTQCFIPGRDMPEFWNFFQNNNFFEE